LQILHSDIIRLDLFGSIFFGRLVFIWIFEFGLI
jgi:hypothetical protein